MDSCPFFSAVVIELKTVLIHFQAVYNHTHQCNLIKNVKIVILHAAWVIRKAVKITIVNLGFCFGNYYQNVGKKYIKMGIMCLSYIEFGIEFGLFCQHKK